MELSKIVIEKFKKIEKLEIQIDDLNILVGQNGSGKSSVLQAVHLASCLFRQADKISKEHTSTVGISELDYLPTDEYKKLGNGASWGNKKGQPSSKVTLRFSSDAEEEDTYIDMKSARNAGISVTGDLPRSVNNYFRGKDAYFSAFIPGISGIPNKESKNAKRAVLKACSYGDSNVYLRNVLNLLTPEDIYQVETWLRSLIGTVKLNVSFDDEKDLYIKAEAEINGTSHPIELLGTGYLQLIQIFCYILLFKPKILLIDEPDIHLHPNVQESLAPVLWKIAREKRVKIVISSHSPFIVRGAPLGANIVWLSDGKVASSNRSMIESAIGWGAFGKKVILITEDKKINLLKAILRQWPTIDSVVAILPGRGYKGLPKKVEAEELRQTLGQKFRLLIHRDRDSMTDDEIKKYKDELETEHIKVWIPELSDVESEFLLPSVLAKVCDMSELDAQNLLNDQISKFQSIYQDQFNKQRTTVNSELYPSGGGAPTNEAAWQEFQNTRLKGSKGKSLLKDVKNATKVHDLEARIEACETLPEIALGLKFILQEIIDGNE